MNAETEIRAALAAVVEHRKKYDDITQRVSHADAVAIGHAFRAAVSQDNIVALLAELDARQAKIDALMLEFCPNEMTDAQRVNWENHQRPISSEKAREIDARQAKIDALEQDNKKLLAALSDLTHSGEFAHWVATQEMCWAAGREFDEAHELVEDQRKGRKNNSCAAE